MISSTVIQGAADNVTKQASVKKYVAEALMGGGVGAVAGGISTRGKESRPSERAAGIISGAIAGSLGSAGIGGAIRGGKMRTAYKKIVSRPRYQSLAHDMGDKTLVNRVREAESRLKAFNEDERTRELIRSTWDPVARGYRPGSTIKGVRKKRVGITRAINLLQKKEEQLASDLYLAGTLGQAVSLKKQMRWQKVHDKIFQLKRRSKGIGADLEGFHRGVSVQVGNERATKHRTWVSAQEARTKQKTRHEQAEKLKTRGLSMAARNIQGRWWGLF